MKGYLYTNGKRKYINDISLMRKLILQLRECDLSYRHSIMNQVANYLASTSGERMSISLKAAIDKQLRSQILRKALKQLSETVNKGLLHPIDQDRTKWVFWTLRCHLIYIDTKMVRRLLIEENHWDPGWANWASRQAGKINGGTTPRLGGPHFNPQAVDAWFRQ